MLDEGLAVLTGLWTGAPFTYHGAYLHGAGCAVCPHRSKPNVFPFWLQACGQARVRFAAPRAGMACSQSDAVARSSRTIFSICTHISTTSNGNHAVRCGERTVT